MHYAVLDEDTEEAGLDGTTRALYRRTNADSTNQTLQQLTGLARCPECLDSCG